MVNKQFLIIFSPQPPQFLVVNVINGCKIIKLNNTGAMLSEDL
jgi:hypothetical protein